MRDTPRRGSISWLLPIVFVLAVAGFFRFHHLPETPGLHFDEAANGFDILNVLAGDRPIFFTANSGREPLFIYWQALFVWQLGMTPFALRLASAFVGILTVAAAHFCFVKLARFAFSSDHQSNVQYQISEVQTTRIQGYALLGSLVLAAGYWHVTFSRIGLRAISLPLFALLGLGWLLAGFSSGRKRDYLLASVFSGLAMYTYFSSWILPVFILMLFIVALALLPKRPILAGLAVFLVTWCLVVLPLGLYYLDHPEIALSRTDEVSIFNPDHSHGDTVGALVGSLARNFRIIAIEDTAVPGGAFGDRAALDPLSATLFWVGSLYLLYRFGRSISRGERRLMIGIGTLLVWLVGFTAPSFLSIHSPYYLRMTTALPAIYLIVAIGAERLGELARRIARPYLPSISRAPLFSIGFAVILIGLTTALNYRDYFRVWLPSDRAYYELMGEKVDTARYLIEWSKTDRLFLAPLYYGDYTVKLAARSVWPKVGSFEPATAAVVPAGQPTRYVFPGEELEIARSLQERIGAGASLETIPGRGGKPLLHVVSLSPKSEESGGIARIGPLIRLVSVGLPIGSIRAGERLPITIRWSTDGKLPESYKVFVHLRDKSHKTISQIDSLPGGGYSTLFWNKGDLIVDEFTLPIAPETPPGEYLVIIGLYHPTSLERIEVRTDAGPVPGNELQIGTIRVEEKR